MIFIYLISFLKCLLKFLKKIKGLVTNHRVIFIKSSEYEFKMIFEITYQELKESKIIQDDNGKIILEIIRNNPNEKNQRFKCETKELGMSLENKISYAIS